MSTGYADAFTLVISTQIVDLPIEVRSVDRLYKEIAGGEPGAV
jgi:hypothetical protein